MKLYLNFSYHKCPLWPLLLGWGWKWGIGKVSKARIAVLFPGNRLFICGSCFTSSTQTWLTAEPVPSQWDRCGRRQGNRKQIFLMIWCYPGLLSELGHKPAVWGWEQEVTHSLGSADLCETIGLNRWQLKLFRAPRVYIADNLCKNISCSTPRKQFKGEQDSMGNVVTPHLCLSASCCLIPLHTQSLMDGHKWVASH